MLYKINAHLTGCRLFGGKQLVVQSHADVTEDLLLVSVSVQLKEKKSQSFFDVFFFFLKMTLTAFHLFQQFEQGLHRSYDLNLKHRGHMQPVNPL